MYCGNHTKWYSKLCDLPSFPTRRKSDNFGISTTAFPFRNPGKWGVFKTLHNARKSTCDADQCCFGVFGMCTVEITRICFRSCAVLLVYMAWESPIISGFPRLHFPLEIHENEEFSKRCTTPEHHRVTQISVVLECLACELWKSHDFVFVRVPCCLFIWLGKVR